MHREISITNRSFRGRRDSFERVFERVFRVKSRTREKHRFERGGRFERDRERDIYIVRDIERWRTEI